MDYTQLEQAVVSLAAVIITGAAAYIASYVGRHVKNQEAAYDIERAIGIGAGVAHAALTASVASGNSVNWAAASQAALQAGTMAAQGFATTVTAEDVQARLAKLLAQDPSVPAGNASSATATALPGESAVAAAG